jgi:hypothetical protein
MEDECPLRHFNCSKPPVRSRRASALPLSHNRRVAWLPRRLRVGPPTQCVAHENARKQI